MFLSVVFTLNSKLVLCVYVRMCVHKLRKLYIQHFLYRTKNISLNFGLSKFGTNVYVYKNYIQSLLIFIEKKKKDFVVVVMVVLFLFWKIVKAHRWMNENVPLSTNACFGGFCNNNNHVLACHGKFFSLFVCTSFSMM